MILSDPFPSLLAQRIVPPPEPVLPVPPRASKWAHVGRFDPYDLDPFVFGPPDALLLQNGPSDTAGEWSSCPCGVTWRGGGCCWACGEAG